MALNALRSKLSTDCPNIPQLFVVVYEQTLLPLFCEVVHALQTTQPIKVLFHSLLVLRTLHKHLHVPVLITSQHVESLSVKGRRQVSVCVTKNGTYVNKPKQNHQ